MKKVHFQPLYIIILLAVVSCISCSKKDSPPPAPPEKLPAPRTDALLPDSIAAVSAFVSGSFSSAGGSNLTETGFCWGTDAMPTIADNYVDVSYNGLAIFTRITGLKESTKYYVRAFGKNSAGIAYGNSVAFTTLTVKPLLQINGIFFLSSDFAAIDCKILSQGNSPIVASGICWSTKPNPTITDDTTKSTQSSGEFVPNMTGLTVNTKYYVRAYATNSDGTGYSDTISVIPAYYIGEKFGGGQIFYIDNTKIHGYIAANEDQSPGMQWFNGADLYTDAEDFYDGATNTKKIINTQGAGTYAATICRGYNGGGYTDWFLPSINQLALLDNVRDKIGNLKPAYYWSSTEEVNYNGEALLEVIGSGLYQDGFKSHRNVVRAVRAF